MSPVAWHRFGVCTAASVVLLTTGFLVAATDSAPQTKSSVQSGEAKKSEKGRTSIILSGASLSVSLLALAVSSMPVFNCSINMAGRLPDVLSGAAGGGILAERSNDEIREALSDIIRDALRASSVIARTRELVRKRPQKRTLLALSDTFNDVLALAHHALLEQQISVPTELEPGLSHVFADRVQIQQVLLNLIMNAIDAMTDVENDRRMIKLCAAREDRFDEPVVLVEVQDFGRGFNASDAERLFDAFYSTKPNGMGMGLPISRSIVEAHGGRLWAAPNQGRGATFYFTLPAEPDCSEIESSV